MKAPSLPLRDTVSSCSSILCSGVPVKIRRSARNLPARSRPGSCRWESREWVLEQTFGVCTSGGISALGMIGMLLESSSGCSGSQASKSFLRDVGSWGASIMLCHRDSNVL